MKKLILFICLVLSITANAQSYYYKSNKFAYKVADVYGNWLPWSDWEASSVPILVDLDNDIIKIFSDKTQIYVITKISDEYYDHTGGKNIMLKVVDSDGLVGYVRFRIQLNNIAQLYIDWPRLMIVYSDLTLIKIR